MRRPLFIESKVLEVLSGHYKGANVAIAELAVHPDLCDFAVAAIKRTIAKLEGWGMARRLSGDRVEALAAFLPVQKVRRKRLTKRPAAIEPPAPTSGSPVPQCRQRPSGRHRTTDRRA